jgi:hypothetical protein
MSAPPATARDEWAGPLTGPPRRATPSRPVQPSTRPTSGGLPLDVAGRRIGVNSAIDGGGYSQNAGQGRSANIGVDFANCLGQTSKTSGRVVVNGQGAHPVVGIVADSLDRVRLLGPRPPRKGSVPIA